ncbi:iron-sulfur cluster repair di-iron protein [Flaviaesturariibacter flavus]|uniref:Iron-sulfur cluster repair di-iron protein n=1 Tax=Flaviaesturariibacter flavus TaxID=2502780 RepID=A0A4R1BQ28_9BACT|nr:iron-sulfur cluster repair di-iron protein [Flaviaesturariibacter flavus]TCJ19628.1 iron-sulfur cluster repair di-iron protein [Flaviaesturariibacter flavus]
MQIETGLTLSQIVSNDFRAARVFERHGLDFCCKGKRPLADACSEKGIDPGTLIAELENATAAPDAAPNFDSFGLSELAGYIQRVHHTYVKVNGPQVAHYLARVASKHGDRLPYIIEVYHLFAELLEGLTEHMQKEEQVLFPRIRLVEAGSLAGSAISGPVAVMESEHDRAGTLTAKIRQLTKDYTAPEGACTTHRMAIAALGDFAQDLHRHVHLENNLLFPKAAAYPQS